jgi:hypothetical protein
VRRWRRSSLWWALHDEDPHDGCHLVRATHWGIRRAYVC